MNAIHVLDVKPGDSVWRHRSDFPHVLPSVVTYVTKTDQGDVRISTKDWTQDFPATASVWGMKGDTAK